MLQPLRAALHSGVHRSCCCSRTFSLSAQSYNSGRKGLVLGVYDKNKEDEHLSLTRAADAFDNVVSGKLRHQLASSGPALKKGKTRDFPSVVTVGLGKQSAGVHQQELWNESKENIRAAVSAGCRHMQDLEMAHVDVDPCGDAQAAAEGAVLGLYEYDELKAKKKKKVSTKLYGRSRSWIEEQQMGAFLSVAKGSDEPPIFLEIHYTGSRDPNESPLVFVGKGVTFDSGGISLKPSSGMDAMRADMGGAATVCSAILTATTLKLPINLIGK
ncbi:unnamed protein product [Ranitomeya imitator]|uniref:Cytosol aminopeptidase domain-containing protein n=1 Tax=Ranitomeya imitator TaxID=111125 RepID=A0ABN9L0M8_9NEOB|nr:unnamed protein product [Ranitomeya imitator]